MNRADILRLLRSDRAYEEVRDVLRPLGEVEVFDGLFWIAVEEPYQERFFPIYSAGNLLFDLNPTCQISCKEAVKALASPGWDVSLEEVPWYLYKQFGMAPIDEAIAQLRCESVSGNQHVYLDTVKYWADIIHQTGIEAIERHRAELE